MRVNLLVFPLATSKVILLNIISNLLTVTIKFIFLNVVLFISTLLIHFR